MLVLSWGKPTKISDWGSHASSTRQRYGTTTCITGGTFNTVARPALPTAVERC
jgi:hypothetical protein